MDQDTPKDRLSRLSTQWTVLFQAHADQAPAEAILTARQLLLDRYESVMRNYLRALLRQTANRDEAVDECFQDFAIRLLKGALKKADPVRGRFRDYLKTCLRNLAMDYLRKEKKRRDIQPLEDTEPAADPVDPTVLSEADGKLVQDMRDKLINDALQALSVYEDQTGKQLFTVLDLRMKHADMHSPEMAEHLAAKLGQKITPLWVRKRLHVAREKLAEFLFKEVARLVESPTREAVEQELTELGLMDYCRDAWAKRQEAE